MIVFNTWWKPSGVAYISTSLAALAEKWGHEVRIVARKFHEKKVHPDWDKRVIHEKSAEATQALTNAKVAVWPEMIWEDNVVLARASGAETYLIPMWEQIHHKHRTALSYYTKLLCPSKATLECFRRQGFSNLEYMPFDPGIQYPSDRRAYNPSEVRILLPLAGAQPRRNTSFILKILGRVMDRYPYAHLTITYLNRWPATAREDLLRLRMAFRDRLNVLCNLGYKEHLDNYANHDLTLWPTDQEGLGIIGSESISCGTPVIAMDIPPMNEYLTNGKDSILLQPTSVKHNWFGVPTGTASPEAFEEALRSMLGRKSKLPDLQKETHGLSTEIQTTFYEGWKRVFGNSDNQKKTKRAKN